MLLTTFAVPSAFADEHDDDGLRRRPTSRSSRHEEAARPEPPSVPSVPAPTPEPEPPPAPPPPSLSDRVTSAALSYLGSPYVFGGASPRTGFDCSGFVQWVMGQVGIPMNRTAGAQFAQGTPIPRDQLQPGDLVFFANTYMPGLSHVGIYIGGGVFVDAGTERTGVRQASLHEPYWAARYVGARRHG